MFETVVKVLADYKDLSPDDITAQSTFEQLGVDSLDTVELVMTLEDETGIKVEMNEKLKTVGELVKLLEEGRA
ncbi:MAG: acyl carrier protein [Eubacteriales bacterium]|nr:acyl carrier protein [Eubacteriales bacterium]